MVTLVLLSSKLNLSWESGYYIYTHTHISNIWNFSHLYTLTYTEIQNTSNSRSQYSPQHTLQLEQLHMKICYEIIYPIITRTIILVKVC